MYKYAPVNPISVKAFLGYVNWYQRARSVISVPSVVELIPTSVSVEGCTAVFVSMVDVAPSGSLPST